MEVVKRSSPDVNICGTEEEVWLEWMFIGYDCLHQNTNHHNPHVAGQKIAPPTPLLLQHYPDVPSANKLGPFEILSSQRTISAVLSLGDR